MIAPKHNMGIVYSIEDKCWVAYDKSRPGCMTHDYTPHKAYKMLLLAQRAWDNIKEGQQIE